MRADIQTLGYFPISPHLSFKFQKLFQRCYYAMKFCMVNKPTIVNRFGLNISHRNITHLAVITRKTTMKMKKLKFESGILCIKFRQPKIRESCNRKYF